VGNSLPTDGWLFTGVAEGNKLPTLHGICVKGLVMVGNELPILHEELTYE
jgi:hypothetical protein